MPTPVLSVPPPKPESEPLAAGALPTEKAIIVIGGFALAGGRVRPRARVDPRHAHGEDEVVTFAREACVRALLHDKHDVLERAVRALVPRFGYADARSRAPAWGDLNVDLECLRWLARV